MNAPISAELDNDRSLVLANTNLLHDLYQNEQRLENAGDGTKRKFEVGNKEPGIINKVVSFFWTSKILSYDYFRVSAKILDSRTSEAYRSVIYKCAQDNMAHYCEDGNERSIFYDGASKDMQINLLFKHKVEACRFQNTLLDFIYVHPTFGNKIQVDETVDEVHLFEPVDRVFYMDYDGADNNESPVLNLADIGDALSSDSESVSYDPVKALQSLEDISMFRVVLKYYWCHLVSRKIKTEKNNENNGIWGTWAFRDYFDALNTKIVDVPLIAVKYVSTAEQTEDIPVGDSKTVTRKKVNVAIEFFDSDVGRRLSIAFRATMKDGTSVVDPLRYESYLYPKDPEGMREFMDMKYEETMKAWNGEMSMRVNA